MGAAKGKLGRVQRAGAFRSLRRPIDGNENGNGRSPAWSFNGNEINPEMIFAGAVYTMHRGGLPKLPTWIVLVDKNT
jgi:hypothetical protein